MSVALRSCIVLLAAATAASTADPDPQDLYRKVRAKVLEDVSHVPRYTCVQTVNRAQYRLQYAVRPSSCRATIAARKQPNPSGLLIVRDRLRLDVAVVDGAETFSWAGARRFETSHVDDLVKSGATGSGEFVSYLNSVFGHDTDSISYLGESLFAFNVPLEKSHYAYRTDGPDRITPYHGFFLVDPATAELKRLTVVADEFPAHEAACRVIDTMDYHRVKIGNGDFLLPETATMDVLFNEGIESRNEISYSDCHEYAGESTIRFDDDANTAAGAAETPKTDAAQPATHHEAPAPQLPKGLRFRIGLTSPIHSETAAAGDAVTGVVLHEVKDRKLGIVAREDDIVHGRILQLEHHMFPFPRWLLAIRFDTLEHNGVEQPLALKPRDGPGTFTFEQAGNVVIDRKFQSEWETR
jgi:hypothetical protein